MNRLVLLWSVLAIITVSCVSPSEYRRTKERSKELERDNVSLKALLKKQHRDIESAHAEKEEAQNHARQLQAKLKESGERIKKLSEQAKEFQSQVEKLVDELATAKTEAVDSRKKNEDSKKIIKSLANDIQQKKDAGEALKASVSNLEKKNAQLIQSAKEGQKKMDDMKAALAKAQKIADAVTQAQSLLKSLQTQLAALQAENAKWKSDNAALKSDNDKLKAENADLKAEKERLEAENKKLKDSS